MSAASSAAPMIGSLSPYGRHRHIRNASTVGSGRTSPWLGRSGEDVGQQFGRSGRARYLGRGRRSGRRPDDQIGLGHIQPGIKQAGDDADLPRIACRSATTEDQRSLARGGHPPCGVGLRLILVGPRPAMPEVVVEVKCRVEEGVVFMGVAFRELPVGRSRWRLPQSRDRGLQGSTHCGYCVHGSHLLPMDHDRRNASTPATRCATGIMPVARMADSGR
jgi:hypothetical protein